MHPRDSRRIVRRVLGRTRWLLLGSLTSIGMLRCPPDSREQAQQWLEQMRPDPDRMPVEDPFVIEARDGILEIEKYLAQMARDRNP